MKFNPYNCETFDTIVSRLDNINPSRIALNKLKHKLLECTYYDSKIKMYVTVRDSTISRNVTSAIHSVLPEYSDIDDYINKHKDIDLCGYITIFYRLLDGSYVLKYKVKTKDKTSFSVPLIDTNIPIKCHRYEINKDEVDITMILDSKYNVDENNIDNIIDDMTYRIIVFSIEPPSIDNNININVDGTMMKLSEFIHNIHKLGMSEYYIQTINNKFSPHIYIDIDRVYVNSYKWIRIKNEEKHVKDSVELGSGVYGTCAIM